MVLGLVPRQQVFFPQNRTKMLRWGNMTALHRILLDNAVLSKSCPLSVFFLSIIVFSISISLPRLRQYNIHSINVQTQIKTNTLSHIPDRKKKSAGVIIFKSVFHHPDVYAQKKLCFLNVLTRPYISLHIHVCINLHYISNLSSSKMNVS